MKRKERRECQITAVTLKSISKLGLIVFVTIPSMLISAQKYSLNLFESFFLIFFLITSLLLAFRAWHLYFDANLLENIGNKTFRLSDIDKSINILFHKKIQNKTLESRIKSCYKLAKSFFVFLIFHLICFLGILIYSLLSASNIIVA